MENIHPDTEQLSSYMESPESSEHKAIRSHLMACENCRSRIDTLSQLELDIKHYAPRFTSLTHLDDDSEQTIERYIDGELDGVEKSAAQQHINSNKNALKSALHYAVHSTAMGSNIDTIDTTISRTTASTSNPEPQAAKGFLHRLIQGLQWPTPAWAMAPVSLAIAAVISYTLISALPESSHQQQARIAAFQDNATITFQQPGMPAGSIGFFHDAQSRSESFSGIDIKLIANNVLDFQWKPITNATEYSIEIYIHKNGEKRLVSQQTSSLPRLTFDNVELMDGKHYEWKLSGKTQNGMQFQTRGDFIYYQSGKS